MAEPFLSEVRIMSFVFAPKGWALCNGQLLPINQNQALFSLLGTTFGGDGRVNFALPDLRSRAPIHVGSGHTLGERGGEQAHTLSIAELPTHTHVLNATRPMPRSDPDRNLLARQAPANPYIAPPSGGDERGERGEHRRVQAHLNMQPFLILSFCIALQGIFPSPNSGERRRHNHTGEIACSPATSPSPAGCSARAAAADLGERDAVR